MKAKHRQSGLSLMEIAVIIATIALLVGLSVPAVRALFNSFETGSSTKSIIDAALSSARAIAAKEQKYAGVRFQKVYQPEGPLNAPQYMIFIIYDVNIPNGVTGNLGCRAVKGIKPIRLPDTVGVMDYSHIQEIIKAAPSWEFSSDPLVFPVEFTNLTTFSILFSPSGKLIIHSLWVRNRNGAPDDDNSSMDDIFNTLTNVRDNNIGMFPQDVRNSEDLPIEDSRNSFIIYEQKEFKRAYESGQGWSGYLRNLEPFYINAYMGTIIE